MCELGQTRLPISQLAFMANWTPHTVCSWRRQIVGSVDASATAQPCCRRSQWIPGNFLELQLIRRREELGNYYCEVLATPWFMIRRSSLRLKIKIVTCTTISLNNGESIVIWFLIHLNHTLVLFIRRVCNFKLLAIFRIFLVSLFILLCLAEFQSVYETHAVDERQCLLSLKIKQQQNIILGSVI